VSDWSEVLSAILQGSILGHILFVLYFAPPHGDQCDCLIFPVANDAFDTSRREYHIYLRIKCWDMDTLKMLR